MRREVAGTIEMKNTALRVINFGRSLNPSISNLTERENFSSLLVEDSARREVAGSYDEGYNDEKWGSIRRSLGRTVNVESLVGRLYSHLVNGVDKVSEVQVSIFISKDTASLARGISDVDCEQIKRTERRRKIVLEWSS